MAAKIKADLKAKIDTRTQSRNKPKPTAKKAEKRAATAKQSTTAITKKVVAAAAQSKAKSNQSTLGATKSSLKTKPIQSKASAVKKPEKAHKGKALKPSVSTKPIKLVTPALAKEMMDELCRLYPEADCELDFKTPFQLLTATIMSAQTTDISVNKCTKELFKLYPEAKALAEADIEDIKRIIKQTGFFNAKAKNIQQCAQQLVERFNGEVPADQDQLVTLPGVGRKTANVVLGVAFGVPGWTVDTHVQRLSHRLGFSKNDDPYKIELDLQKLFANRDWTKLSITLIWHGRRMCFARKPACEICPVNKSCPSSLML
jgi:endonuclease-3